MRYVLDAAYPTSTLACVQPPPTLRRKAEKGPFSVFFLEGRGRLYTGYLHSYPLKLKQSWKTHLIKNALQSRNVEDAGLS